MSTLSKKTLVLCIGLCVALLTVFAVTFCVLQPTTLASASIGVEELKIGGVTFEDGQNNYYLNGDTDTFTGDAENFNAKFEPTEGRLTLNNFVGTFTSQYGIQSISSNALEIVLIGNNSITVQPDFQVNYNGVVGITTGNDLTLSGTGKLTINISYDQSGNTNCYGIYSLGNFSLPSGTLEVNIGDNYFDDNGDISLGHSYGIYAGCGVTISGNSAVTLNVKKFGRAGGIYCGWSIPSDLNISTSGIVNINIPNDYPEYYFSIGLQQGGNGNINLTGSGTINIKGVDGQLTRGIHIGNYTDNYVRIENGTVTVDNALYGILSEVSYINDLTPDIKITNATISLTQIGKGIRSINNGVLINNSNVSIDATGDASSEGTNNGIAGAYYGSTYGVNVFGNTTIDIVYGEDGNGIAGGNIVTIENTKSYFDLTGGSITLKNTQNVAPNAVEFLTKLGNNTLLTCGVNNDCKYYNNEGIVKFEYKPSHAITFDANGGTGEMAGTSLPETLTYQLPACTFTAPANKRFSGWKVGGVDKQPGDTITMAGADISVVAQWESYWTVSFDANGGTGEMESQDVLPGAYELPNDATFTAPNDKGFAGWALTADGPIIQTSSIDVQANVTLFAKWDDIMTISTIIGTSNIAGGVKVSEVELEFEDDYYTWFVAGIYDWENAFSYTNVDPMEDEDVLAKDHTYILVVNFFLKKPNVFANSMDVTIDDADGKIGSSLSVNGLQGKRYAFAIYIPADLVFQDSEELDIPNSVAFDTNSIPFGSSVTGGIWPYTFSIVGEVPGLYFNNQNLKYMRTEKTAATTATIKVTDKRGVEATVEINIGAVCEREQSASMCFTATGYDSGMLAQSDEPFRPYKFSLDGEESWTTVETAEYVIESGIDSVTISCGIKYIVLGDIERLTADSYAFTLNVHRASAPNAITTTACTTEANNDGQINNISSSMEYRLSTANQWTDCVTPTTGPLPAGTYYVRNKAFSNSLTSEYVSVTIAEYSQQLLDGTVTIQGDLAFGETLTADTSGLTNATGTLSYQWKRNGNAIAQATASTYTLVQADIGTTITVAVTSSEEVGEIVGSASDVISKATQTAKPQGLVGVRPLSLTQETTGRITGVDETMEWSNIDDNYVAVQGTEITGLTLGKYYVRYKATATHFAGEYVNVTVPQAWATITFKAGQGTGEMAPVQVELGQVYVLPESTFTPPQDKTFQCWSVDGYNRPVGYEYSVNWDININAVYANVVTMHFDAGQGSGEMEDVERPVHSEYVLPESTFTPPQGKYFYRWNWNETSYGEVGSFASVDTQDITFIATYEDRFEVSFVAGEGSGEMASQLGGHLYRLPQCTFQAPQGKIFAGWSVTTNGATWDAQPGDNVIVIAAVTVTALWEHAHSMQAIAAKAASCSANGNTAYWHCTGCDKYFADEEGEEEITLESTVIAKTAHTEETIPAVPATCSATGLTQGKRCSVCGEILVEQEVVAKLPHTEIDDPAVAPTCTESGLTAGKHCSVCGAVIVAQEVVPATGHDWGEWTVTTPAQPGVKGVETRICKNDASHKETRDIPALPYEPKQEGDKVVYEESMQQGVAKDVTAVFTQAKDGNGQVELSVGQLQLSFDQSVVDLLGGQDIQLTATVQTQDLPVEGALMVVEVSLTGANSNFGEGKVTLSTPFNAEVPEGKVVNVYYVDGETKVLVPSWIQDGNLFFETSHFSTFAVLFENAPFVTPDGGLSGGAIAGIVIAVLLVVGVGGFCIWWFLLAKRRLSDLFPINKAKEQPQEPDEE